MPLGAFSIPRLASSAYYICTPTELHLTYSSECECWDRARRACARSSLGARAATQGSPVSRPPASSYQGGRSRSSCSFSGCTATAPGTPLAATAARACLHRGPCPPLVEAKIYLVIKGTICPPPPCLAAGIKGWYYILAVV